MTKRFFLQIVLTAIILFSIVFVWEFLIESWWASNESDSEHWQYIITIMIFGIFTLIFPSVISVKEWGKRQRAQEEVRNINKELLSAIEQTSSIIDFKILDKNYDAMMVNPCLEKCWEKMHCCQKDCLCYGKDPLRCWQVAGTLCKGNVQGVFVQKYVNCYECEVYKSATRSPRLALREHLNNMIHVLEVQKKELSEALNEVKTLRGVIPICSYCKKIRNDRGAWDILESYISDHSNAEFSHGICPECYEKQMAKLE